MKSKLILCLALLGTAHVESILSGNVLGTGEVTITMAPTTIIEDNLHKAGFGPFVARVPLHLLLGYRTMSTFELSNAISRAQDGYYRKLAHERYEHDGRHHVPQAPPKTPQLEQQYRLLEVVMEGSSNKEGALQALKQAGRYKPDK